MNGLRRCFSQGRSALAVTNPGRSTRARLCATVAGKSWKRCANGTSSSAPRVSCQERVAIAATMSTSDTELLTTEDNTEVNACWAPCTSLFKQ